MNFYLEVAHIALALYMGLVSAAQPRTSEIMGGADRDVRHPEQLSGEWESQDASGGAVGITLQLTTTASGNVTTLAQIPQKFEALKIGVYRRAGAQRSVGDTNWLDTRSVEFHLDDLRLIASDKSLGIDLNLYSRSNGQEWAGRFHRGSFDHDVTLLRPSAHAGVSVSGFVGAWKAEGTANITCLHIMQQSDGALTGWSDNLWLPGLTLSAPGMKRPEVVNEIYGTQGIVSQIGPRAISFAMNAYAAACCSPTFGGRLLADGQSIQGSWDTTRAAILRKMRGDSCITAR